MVGWLLTPRSKIGYKHMWEILKLIYVVNIMYWWSNILVTALISMQMINRTGTQIVTSN